MLQNEYLLANAGADTAKNEPTLHKFGQICELKSLKATHTATSVVSLISRSANAQVAHRRWTSNGPKTAHGRAWPGPSSQNEDFSGTRNNESPQIRLQIA